MAVKAKAKVKVGKKPAPIANTLIPVAASQVPIEEAPTGPKVNPFTFVEACSFSKRDLLTEETAREYVPYLINKAFSAFPDTLSHAQFLNLNHNALTKQMQHDYLLHGVKRRRRWKAYLKRSDEQKQAAVQMGEIAAAGKYSVGKVRQMMSLLTPDQREQVLRATYPEQNHQSVAGHQNADSVIGDSPHRS